MQRKTIEPKEAQKKSTQDQKKVSIEKRLQKTNELLRGSKEAVSVVLPEAKKYKKEMMQSYEHEDDDYDDESSANEEEIRDKRPAQILNRAQRRDGDKPGGKKAGFVSRKAATKLRDKKLASYSKQENEIFQQDFNPKKCKTVNRKQYVNNAARPYDDAKDGDDSWEEEQDDDDEAYLIK